MLKWSSRRRIPRLQPRAFAPTAGRFAGSFWDALGLAPLGLAVTPQEVAHLGLWKHLLVTA